MAPKSKPKSMLSSKGVFLKKPCFSVGKIRFFDIQWVEVGSKNRSKNGIQDGVHLGIDFRPILVDSGSQVGRENGVKINPKRHRNNDAKKKGTKAPRRVQARIQGPGSRPGSREDPLNHAGPEGRWDNKI